MRLNLQNPGAVTARRHLGVARACASQCWALCQAKLRVGAAGPAVRAPSAPPAGRSTRALGEEMVITIVKHAQLAAPVEIGVGSA